MKKQKILIKMGGNMNRNKESLGTLYSWPAIIIAMFIFWPVGLFLLYSRAKQDRKTVFIIGKMVAVAGGFLMLGSIMRLIAAMADDETTSGTYVIIVITFVLPSIAMLLYSNKLRKESTRYKLYLSSIVNGNEKNLNNISTIVKQPINIVKKDLQNMIKGGYLANAYIDHNRGVICLVNAQGAQNFQGGYAGGQQQASGKNQSSGAFTCKCCGANNSGAGGNSCEYCGTVRG